jgi:hypothetical protein
MMPIFVSSGVGGLASQSNIIDTVGACDQGSLTEPDEISGRPLSDGKLFQFRK